jgi:hypothetical protein
VKNLSAIFGFMIAVAMLPSANASTPFEELEIKFAHGDAVDLSDLPALSDAKHEYTAKSYRPGQALPNLEYKNDNGPVRVRADLSEKGEGNYLDFMFFGAAGGVDNSTDGMNAWGRYYRSSQAKIISNYPLLQRLSGDATFEVKRSGDKFIIRELHDGGMQLYWSVEKSSSAKEGGVEKGK